RARQFELIALRELANEVALQGVITPILEPVKEAHNNLNLAYKVFQERQQTAFLVVNPTVGERAGDHNHYLDYLHGLEGDTFKPALHYRNNPEFINESIAAYGLADCMIICPNELSVEDADFRALVQSDAIQSI